MSRVERHRNDVSNSVDGPKLFRLSLKLFKTKSILID